jgi:hypothetical protein
MATADPDQPPSADETAAPETTASADEELRRRYLEALERKRAGGSAAATGHGADRANTPTSNDKVKRTFRRRAGG